MDRLIAHEDVVARFNVIGATSNGETALDLLRANPIDIALIDMEMVDKDGQYVLDAMSVTPGHKPVFILLYYSPKPYNASGCRLNYFVSKHLSMNLLVNKIEKIWGVKTKKISYRAKADMSNNELANDMMPLLPRKPIRKQPKYFIQELLHKIGAPAHLQGSQYLQTAFLVIVEDGKYRSGDLMNRIYPAVAKHHDTKPQHVERSIRYMADQMMEKGRDLIITNYLSIPRVTPGKRITNGELLAALAYCYFKDNEAAAENRAT